MQHRILRSFIIAASLAVLSTPTFVYGQEADAGGNSHPREKGRTEGLVTTPQGDDQAEIATDVTRSSGRTAPPGTPSTKSSHITPPGPAGDSQPPQTQRGDHTHTSDNDETDKEGNQ
jgi:hypothetical protein